MGTAIYGSYDELVFELSVGDRLRTGVTARTVRVKLDDVTHVWAADPADLVSYAGERVLRIGRVRAGRRVVVLEVLRGRSCAFDRILVANDEADAAVAGLHRSGIGRGALLAA
jgi:hypothetical protein